VLETCYNCSSRCLFSICKRKREDETNLPILVYKINGDILTPLKNKIHSFDIIKRQKL